MGSRHSVWGRGPKMRCGQDFRLWLPLLLGTLTHVCTGSWGVAAESSQAESHRAQVAFSQEVPSLAQPGLGTMF